jgi:hypothetical protein
MDPAASLVADETLRVRIVGPALEVDQLAVPARADEATGVRTVMRTHSQGRAISQHRFSPQDEYA